MTNDNAQKQKDIDEVLLKYKEKMSTLKQKRDKIIAGFSEALKERKLEELRNSIKQS